MNKLFGLFLLALACWAPSAAYAVNCFWVGGTANWDGTNTGGGGAGGIKWASASGGGTTCSGGGTGGSPGAADNPVIDGHVSGLNGGTITVTTNFSVGDLTTSLMNGTLNFGATTPTIAGSNGWINNGTGTRTIGFGTANVTVQPTTTNSGMDWGTTTNLVLTANTGTITLSGALTGTRLVDLGGATIANLPSFTFATNSSRGIWQFSGTSSTVPTFTIGAPNYIAWGTSSVTLTNLVCSGSSVSNPIQLQTNAAGSQRTIPLTNSASCPGLAAREMNSSTGTITANPGIDLGRNGANILITPPSGGGGGGRIIGG